MVLEKMDVPYIEWNLLRDKAYAKDPYKMNGMSVFGKYISKMKLNNGINILGRILKIKKKMRTASRRKRSSLKN